MTIRAIVDLLILTGIVGAGVLAKAWADGTLPPPEVFPWPQVIQGVITILTAVLAWLVRNQVQQLHTTVNSKMDKLLELTAIASKAEGVLEERTRWAAKEKARAEGIQAERDRKETP